MSENKQVDAKTARQEIFNVKFDVDIACHVVQALVAFLGAVETSSRAVQPGWNKAPDWQRSRVGEFLGLEVDHLIALRTRQRDLELRLAQRPGGSSP